jgi:hypothetical protein
LCALNAGGKQGDITYGKSYATTSDACLIENGKIMRRSAEVTEILTCFYLLNR